ncbi:MAG: hypothetical protein QOE65_360 [Solirubrobacteraceae bacterium]|jgi:hypothetical protein|nr:hypothetical protein [Solirubrobacteraceae bacterium]
MYVNFKNSAHCVSSFALEWNGGETDRTKEVKEGDTATIDLSNYAKLADGTSCWARAYVVAGTNHDSEDNFNYDLHSQLTAYYELVGSAAHPRFKFNGIH